MTPDTIADVAKDWTPEQVDQAIKQLAELRSQMQPPIPMEFKYGTAVEAIDGPRWNTQREALEGKSLIHFRHPGLGWLHFALPSDEARKLAGHLLKQAATTESQNGETPNA